MRLLPLWQKQWVALAIRMKRLHLLDRDDRRTRMRSFVSIVMKNEYLSKEDIGRCRDTNIREDNPVKYTQVKAEQERLRAGVSR